MDTILFSIWAIITLIATLIVLISAFKTSVLWGLAVLLIPYWCTTTVISSIRINGETACMAIDAAMSGDVFRAYVEHILVPSLREDDIVILDNLSAHKDKAALEMIEETGTQVRFLPPYSPDFNPIEKMWSKVKQLLRGMKARTEEALLVAIGMALSCVTEADALGWFASCGYSVI